MTHKSALLGCGPRAAGHAEAYKLITRGTLDACCDLDAARRGAFAEKHGIPRQYADLDEMLATEKPDVVHMVTAPTLRVELMTRLADAGVPGVIVEKPVCIGVTDYKALRRLEASATTRFAVNFQLRHHPKVLELLDMVQSGAIGEVRYIDASCMLPMAGQGVHALDLMFAFSGYPTPASVVAAAAGYDDINGTHPTAKTMAALITFADGKRATLHAGAGAPIVEPPGVNWRQKRIAVYGTHGFCQWWMNGWERSLANGQVEKGRLDYGEQDPRGQAALTNAMFDWLENAHTPSPTSLRTSLDQWQTILATYQSVVAAQPVAMPFEPADDLFQRFIAHVSGAPCTFPGY